jgi:peptidoglycan/xylan/chitin deacetylase (PgdA/CDA1 family)
MANSRWRQERLLILCYHGTSLADEHLWRPYLFIHPDKLQKRLESLKKGRFSVLPLAEALQRLQAGNLPPRSIVLTFDDGLYDFYWQAFPLLKHYGFPATVYQTTYYTSLQLPVFNLICSYMLWKGHNQSIADGTSVGLPGKLDLRTGKDREAIVRRLVQNTARKTGAEKDAVAAQLARLLEIDYPSLKQKRILQLMNAHELQEIARNGIDLQLHTHRHLTPEDESLFRKEIQDNRSVVERFVVAPPVHFCYPSGVYREAFLPWLRKENVLSATTCDTGLAQRNSEMLLLPRYIDHERRRQVEFESWTSGVGDLLALRRKAVQRPIPSLGYGPSTPS